MVFTDPRTVSKQESTSFPQKKNPLVHVTLDAHELILFIDNRQSSHCDITPLLHNNITFLFGQLCYWLGRNIQMARDQTIEKFRRTITKKKNSCQTTAIGQ
jgi:hypothetical protein